jgi:hypothetical protein
MLRMVPRGAMRELTYRHSGEGRNPVRQTFALFWIPACAGMTAAA